MTDHVIGDINRDMAASVVDGDRMTYHLREDDAGAAPGSDNFLIAGAVHLLDLFSPEPPQDARGIAKDMTRVSINTTFKNFFMIFNLR